MTTPYAITGDTWYVANEIAHTIRPNVEVYACINGKQTGAFDFDIKNIVVYDETDQKYLPSISDNAKAGTTVEMGDSDATVTAVWEPNTYKVSYDINGGTGTIEDQSFTYGNTSGSTISATKPTKKGYTFAGWRWDDPNDESNSFQLGKTILELERFFYKLSFCFRFELEILLSTWKMSYISICVGF